MPAMAVSPSTNWSTILSGSSPTPPSLLLIMHGVIPTISIVRNISLGSLQFALASFIDKSTGSMERDENYVPKTRSELGLAPEKLMKRRDYQEIFEEAPIYTILRMLLMQSVGWVVYLTVNSLGSPMYPKGTGVGLFSMLSLRNQVDSYYISALAPKFPFVPRG